MTPASPQMDHEYIERHSVLERYRADKLEDAESEAFEIHFLDCAMCRARLQADTSLAEGFKAAAAAGLSRNGSTRRTSSRWLAPYALAASVLLATAAGMLVWRGSGPSPTLPTQVVPLLAQRDGGASTAVDLRIGETPELVVLVVDGVQPELHRYEVSIADANGRVVFGAGDLDPQLTLNANRLVVPVPSSSLQPGDLQLTVRGHRADGTVIRTAHFGLRVTPR